MNLSNLVSHVSKVSEHGGPLLAAFSPSDSQHGHWEDRNSHLNHQYSVLLGNTLKMIFSLADYDGHRDCLRFGFCSIQEKSFDQMMNLML